MGAVDINNEQDVTLFQSNAPLILPLIACLQDGLCLANTAPIALLYRVTLCVHHLTDKLYYFPDTGAVSLLARFI